MNGISDYIWQRRIHHGVRNQKHAVPFPASVKVGLEFNAALERKEKLDPCLLTNGVMLELCGFARTVTKSEAYFLFEMLEFNFDLGVDTDDYCQCYEYGRRVYNKIKLLKEQIKMKPRRWTETFVLPDRATVMGFTRSEQPGRYFPKRNQIVDSSVLTDGSKNSQSVENQKSESNGAAGSAFFVKKRGGVILKVTDDGFPFCKKLGVTLIVRTDDKPKQKLDPNLLTNGVMLELLDFSRLLCGTHTGIVCDLVEQNFGIKLEKMLVRMHVSRLIARNNACLTAKDKEAFRKEPFTVHTKKQRQYQKKRPNPDTDFKELERLTMASKRRGTLRHSDDDAKAIWQDVDLSYTCPVDFEAEIQSDTKAEPGKMKFESCLSEAAADTNSTLSLDVKQEEEEVFVSPLQPQTDGRLSKLRPKNTTLKVESNLFLDDEKGKVKVKTLRQELWMRRRTRAKQILKSSRVNDLFARCRGVGLDFNVGSGNKQNLDLQLLTNCVLWEVYKFAVAMRKSLRSFLLDILSSNFKLVLHDEIHQRNFIVYVLTKEKILQNNHHNQKIEFLSSPFQFPEVYTTVGVTSDYQTGQDSETEQQTGTNWDSPAGQQAGPQSHPFCNKLGLNLWSTEQRPASQKLDLNVLTRGAMLEIFAFIRELCGAVHETVNDVLEHNFDLDLQSGETEAAQVIQRWYTTQRSIMKKSKMSAKINTWLSSVVPVNDGSQLDPETTADLHLEDLDPEDLKPDREIKAFNGNVLQLERLNSFNVCKDIGVDLDVGSKSKAKTKLDLGLLTRGVLFEMHRYVVENSQRYVSALYEILEYNFDLSSQNHRKVEFAWSIASQVIAMAGKNCRNGNYQSRVFELPFKVSDYSQIVCKDEPEDDFSELDRSDESDVMFVQELKPVDIEVEID